MRSRWVLSLEFFGPGLDFILFFGHHFGRGLGQEVFVGQFALGLGQVLAQFLHFPVQAALASSEKSMMPASGMKISTASTTALAAAAGGPEAALTVKFLDPGQLDLDGLAVAVQGRPRPRPSGLWRKTSTWVAGGTFISPRRLRMAVMVSMTRCISASAAGLSRASSGSG